MASLQSTFAGTPSIGASKGANITSNKAPGQSDLDLSSLISGLGSRMQSGTVQPGQMQQTSPQQRFAQIMQQYGGGR